MIKGGPTYIGTNHVQTHATPVDIGQQQDDILVLYYIYAL